MADSVKKSVFEVLNAINVNGHTEVKEVSGTKLTYLSWAWAWAEVKKAYPDAVYEIEKFNGIPYAYDPITGFMVYTKVTIGGITHEMWLPVMDGQNRAMKAEPYQIQTKYKTITVQAATMFDVNKTIMRCLVKNLAMFGLGLYIYAGEDLPEYEEATVTAPAKAKKSPAPAPVPEPVEPAPVETAPAETKQKNPVRVEFLDYVTAHGLDLTSICKTMGINNESTDDDFKRAKQYAESLVNPASLLGNGQIGLDLPQEV